VRGAGECRHGIARIKKPDDAGPVTGTMPRADRRGPLFIRPN